MNTNKPFHARYKRLLAGTTVAGMAAVMLATGAPVAIYEAYAQPVTIEQPPQVPGFADIVEAVSPAVVSIRVRNGGDEDEGEETAEGPQFDIPGLEDLPEDHPMRRFFDEFGNPFGGSPFGDRGEGPHDGMPRFAVSQGSGFFISEDGYIVTNNHVIEGGSEYSIILNDGTEFKAELVGTDSRTDLAVLKVDADRSFPYVEFGNDEETRIGDWVVAVGNPFGLGGSVTAGIVSARGREIGAGPYDDFIQVDAAVNRGNSGGPTFNLSGEVIGVNTAIFSPSGGNVGIAFAIPSSLAQDVVNELIEDGSVERGWIGVRIQPVTDEIAESLGLDEASGALIAAPTPGGPSAEAGVESGDVVLAVNGNEVEDPGDLAREIASMDPGTDVTLTLWRNGSEEEVEVELGTFPSEEELATTLGGEDGEEQAEPSSDQELPDFGMTVVPAENGDGVVVSDLDPSGVAAERGFRVGDTIVSVQNKPVSSAEDISAAVEEAAGNDRGAALFQIERDGDNRFVALPIEQG